MFSKLDDPAVSPEPGDTQPRCCCGRSLFMPFRHFRRIRFPPDQSVTAGSVINNIKLWTSGWWYNVPADFPAALAGTSSLCYSRWISWSHRCVTESPLWSHGCVGGYFWWGPSPGTHTRSGRASDMSTLSKVCDGPLMKLFNACITYLVNFEWGCHHIDKAVCPLLWRKTFFIFYITFLLVFPQTNLFQCLSCSYSTWITMVFRLIKFDKNLGP